MPSKRAVSSGGKAQGKSKLTLSLAPESPPPRKIKSFFGVGVGSELPNGTTRRSATAPAKIQPQAQNIDVKGKSKAAEADVPSDHQLWSDFFTPRRRDEIAGNKKKVELVEGWLREALEGKPALRKYRRLLILSGPAGAGKSAVVRALSGRQELDFHVIDWANETTTGRNDVGYMQDYQAGESSNARPATAQGFDDFLYATGRYSALSVGVDEESPSSSSSAAQCRASPTNNSDSSTQKRVVLVEDLPNVQHAPTKAAFHDSLRVFLASKTAAPLILVVSETSPRLDEYGSGENARTIAWRDRQDAAISVRGLVSQEVLTSPYCTHIEFNPVAPTYLSKPLKAALDQARKQLPAANGDLPASTSATGKDLVAAVVRTANGDIRSALNTLQFACIHGRLLSRLAAEGEMRGTKRTSQGKKKQQGDELRKSLSAITGRESSMELFHAVGRILYNKRHGDPQDDNEEASGAIRGEDMAAIKAKMDTLLLPTHLSHLSRRQSKVDVEDLWRSLPTDSSTFLSWLHQNYTPFTSTVEQCADIVEHLSFGEAELRPGQGGDPWSNSGTSDYYGFLVGTQGTLFSLPSPVPQRSDPQTLPTSSQTKTRGLHRFHGVKMFQVMKRKREMEDMIRESKDRGVDQRLGVSMDELVTLTYPIMAKIKSNKSFESDNVAMRVGRLPWEEESMRDSTEMDEDEALEEADLVETQQPSTLTDTGGSLLDEKTSKVALETFVNEEDDQFFGDEENEEDEEIEDADG